MKHAYILSGVLFFVFILDWGTRVRRTIIQDRIRKHLNLVVIMMLLWVVLRTMRYVTADADLQRIWWYCYSIPMMGLPLFGFKISKYLGTDNSYVLPNKYLVLDAITGVILMFALTNDLHFWVYSVDDTDPLHIVFTINSGYYVMVAWIALLCLLAIFTILRKSRTSFSKYYYMYPLVVISLGGGYTVYNFLYTQLYHREPLIEAGAMTCWVYIAMWETMITMGLIPNNHDYVDFFNASSLSAYITDKRGKALHLSLGAEAISKEEFDKLRDEDSLQLSEYKEARISPLEDGYVVYVNDMTEVQELIEELEDVRENLTGEQLLLEKIAEAEAARVRIEEKERLFRKMSDASRKQVTEVRELLDAAETAEGAEQKTIWQKILVLGTFLKRHSNLLLIGESGRFTTSTELKLSLQQSLENLHLAGPMTGMLIEEDKNLEVEWVIRCYVLYEALIEHYFNRLESIHVMFNQRGDKNVYLIEAECKGEKPLEFTYPEEIEGTLQIEEDENIIRVCYKWDSVQEPAAEEKEGRSDETV